MKCLGGKEEGRRNDLLGYLEYGGLMGQFAKVCGVWWTRRRICQKLDFQEKGKGGKGTRGRCCELLLGSLEDNVLWEGISFVFPLGGSFEML